jgi:uncharacterized coiled-coil protein SlyX
MIEAFGAGYLLKQVRDMILAISGLKAADKKSAEDIAKINKKLRDHERRMERGEKIQKVQADEIAELQEQVAELSSEVDHLNSKNHGLKVMLGKSKAKNERLTKQ